MIKQSQLAEGVRNNKVHKYWQGRRATYARIA